MTCVQLVAAVSSTALGASLLPPRIATVGENNHKYRRWRGALCATGEHAIPRARCNGLRAYIMDADDAGRAVDVFAPDAPPITCSFVSMPSTRVSRS